MDLDDLDTTSAAEKGATITIRHPITGEDLEGSDGKPCTLQVLGADSKEWKRAVADSMKSTKNRRNLTVADAERSTIEMLARVTTGMSENWVWGKKPLPFSKENITRLYSERPWIREQVDIFVGDRANFLASD